MHILHVYRVYMPDDFTGIPRVIDGLATGGQTLGMRSSVLTLSKAPSVTQPVTVNGTPVYQAKNNVEIQSAGFSWNIFRIFAQLQDTIDIVHYHFPWPMADLLHYSKRRRIPSVVTYHSDVVKQKHLLHLYKPLRNRFLGSVDRIVATSPIYAETSEVLGTYRNKTEVIPIGIGPRPQTDPQRLAKWKARLGEGFFLFIGSDRYYKGLPYLLEAARTSGLPLVLVGSIAQKNVSPASDNVINLGRIEDQDKAAIIELCRALVLPSCLRSEAFGVVLLESMRAKKPIITCEIGSGMSFVNAHQTTGLIVPPHDPNALAAAMRKLAEDPDLVTRMGEAAEHRFQHLFQREQMAKAYHELYGRLLGARSGA